MNFKFEAPKQEAPQENRGKGSESVLELARKGSALVKAHQEKNPGTIESASQSDDSKKTSEQDDEVLSYHKQRGPSTKEEILKESDSNKNEAWPV